MAKRLFSSTLSFADVACIRGNRLLFQNFSASLAAGGVLRLAGANGAGKTSLLRIVARALPHAAGRILWDGVNILENENIAHNARFAFLPADDRDLKLLETARENLHFWAVLWCIENSAAAIDAALAAMGLSSLADTPVRVFSAGQKRRLSLARIILKQCPLWLLDEPFNALDDAAIDLLSQAMAAHLAAGGMVMMATHHHPDIKNMQTAHLAAAQVAA
ncbi:MAG: heme ABC exporter ATP-binding protein CcmA [Alphaproteobacteria bacterium]|nr:heme ABC exporter ATP-binding protein CcmA [Alphaproteobacteria bacterium]